MKRLILLGVIILTHHINAQNRDYHYYKSLGINVGYSYNFRHHQGEKTYHLIDLGVHKLNYGGMHGGGVQRGIGMEVGLNTNRVIVAPKITGIAYYQGLVLGLEFATYTDFRDVNLMFMPMIGFGGNGFRVTANPHISLLNPNFHPINKGNVNISFIIPLTQEKRKE